MQPEHDILLQRQELCAAIGGWFKRHARAMPWRETKDPYAIWVSETMLQQTQVATVIPYYHRFLERFPNVKALAEAGEQEVLAMWAGLGYYRRVKHLHAAAKMVVRDFGGEVPGTAAQLLMLPGVGRYTAGAVASIAFGEQAAVLDGNVMRVLARLGGIREDIAERKTLEKLWVIADGLAPKEGAGDFNQGMMELGATVCVPVGPKCKECPLMGLCVARAEGVQGELPVKRKKGVSPVVRRVAVVLVRRVPTNGQKRTVIGSQKTPVSATIGYINYGKNPIVEVMMMRRPEGGIWGGMWEFPTVEVSNQGGGGGGRIKIKIRSKIKRGGEGGGDRSVGGRVGGKGNIGKMELNGVGGIADVVVERLGLRLELDGWVGSVRHVLTHRVMEYAVVRGVSGGLPAGLPVCDGGVYEECRWVRWPAEGLPVAKVVWKVALAAGLPAPG